MNIIKHGTTYKERYCSDCSALFSYSKKDIKIENTFDEVFGEYHSNYCEYILCPECNYKKILKLKIDGKDAM
jgi:hypothetical protein